MLDSLPSELQKRLSWSLLILRVTVFIVIFVWTLDKFINPAHGAKIFEIFYSISNVPLTLIYILGVIQLVLAFSLLAGVAKRISYGAILLLHAVSTFSSFPRYIDAFNNLLFFAAWPMLGACIVLYILRDYDTCLTFKGKK